MLTPKPTSEPHDISVQIPPSGTRGAFFPRFPGWLAHRLNRMLANRYRRKGGTTIRGVQGVILETIGAKSGMPRQAVVGHVADGPDAWLIIASAGGAAHHPHWFFNLAKNPEATLEFGDGRRVAVRAETPVGADLDAAWETIGTVAPIYVGYRTKTDRDIPVIRLRAVD
ncbi:MAG: nitroreductase/quinone reductase family protein [Chloroflexota bacterium]